MKTLLLLLLLSFSFAALAQDSQPQQREKETMEEEGNQETQEPRDNEEEKTPQLKTVNDTLKHTGKEILIDSLNSRQELLKIPDVKIDSTNAGKAKQQVKAIAKDSLNNQKLLKENELVQKALQVPLDSTATDKAKQQVKSVAINSLNNQSFIKGNEWIGDVRELEQLREIPKDSLGGHIKNELSVRGEQYLKNTEPSQSLSGMETPEGFASMQEYQQKMEEIQQQLREAEARDALKQKLATQGRQFASQHMQEIQQVQDQMGEIKQKYSEVTDSQDLSSAVKRTSLEGEPTWKRLVLGGNFNISKTNPLNIDIAPIIGYKFNKLFEAGVSASYRSQFRANRHRVSQSNEEVYGFSAFASHMVFKSFFGYIESERMHKSGSILETRFSKWHQTLLVGIGRRFPLTNWLEMQSIITVNLLHDNKDGLYNSPVVFKMGVRKR